MFNLKKKQKSNPPPGEGKGGQKLVEGEEILLEGSGDAGSILKEAEKRIQELQKKKQEDLAQNGCGC